MLLISKLNTFQIDLEQFLIRTSFFETPFLNVVNHKIAPVVLINILELCCQSFKQFLKKHR